MGLESMAALYVLNAKQPRRHESIATGLTSTSFFLFPTPSVKASYLRQACVAWSQDLFPVLLMSDTTKVQPCILLATNLVLCFCCRSRGPETT